MGFGTPPTPAVELEGDYSTWTKITDVELDTSDQTNFIASALLYIDHVNAKVILDDRANKKIVSCNFDGSNCTLLASGDYYRGGVDGGYFSEVKGSGITSLLGKYGIILNIDTGDTYVLKNGQIIQTIPWEPTSYFYPENVAISSNGQYIVLVETNVNGKRLRLVMYEGS